MESESEVAQSCLTLCDPVDCSLPGSSAHGILQAVEDWHKKRKAGQLKRMEWESRNISTQYENLQYDKRVICKSEERIDLMNSLTVTR